MSAYSARLKVVEIIVMGTAATNATATEEARISCVLGYSRRVWHVRDISAYGVISEVPLLRLCRLKASGWTDSSVQTGASNHAV
jgi:hypothetical protein